MKFLKDDDSFDAVTFAKVVEFVITAMDISICFADFPTEKIGDTTRASSVSSVSATRTSVRC